MKQSKVRIIGGQLRGRLLPIAEVNGLRPTTDRVRETLFNWLQYEIAGSSCLDAFSGTGALGFEALSRGAKHVSFCEVDRFARRQIIDNIKLFSLQNAKLESLDGLTMLEKGKFDGVFLDPPYRLDLLPRAIEVVASLSVKPDWIYLEHDASIEPIVQPLLQSGYSLHRNKKAGRVCYGLLLKSL